MLMWLGLGPAVPLSQCPTNFLSFGNRIIKDQANARMTCQARNNVPCFVRQIKVSSCDSGSVLNFSPSRGAAACSPVARAGEGRRNGRQARSAQLSLSTIALELFPTYPRL